MPSISLPSCSCGRQNVYAFYVPTLMLMWQENSHTFYFSALMLRWQAEFPCPHAQVAGKFTCLLFPYPDAQVAGKICMPSISLPSCSCGRQNSHALYFPVLIFQQTDPLYTLRLRINYFLWSCELLYFERICADAHGIARTSIKVKPRKTETHLKRQCQSVN